MKSLMKGVRPQAAAHWSGRKHMMSKARGVGIRIRVIRCGNNATVAKMRRAGDDEGDIEVWGIYNSEEMERGKMRTN